MVNVRENQSLRTIVVDARADAERSVASEIAELVRSKPACVLGLATGMTPIGVYAELARMHRDERLDLSCVVTFNLDEYIGLPSGDPRTFRRWMQARFFDHVNVRAENIHLPECGEPEARTTANEARERSIASQDHSLRDASACMKDDSSSASKSSSDQLAKSCERYEHAIADAGGIDLLILGIGRNGHIGFNEPGSARSSRTRVVDLSAMTRADAATTFGGIERVPERAITMGLATILEARAIRVMAFGREKSEIVARTLSEPIGVALPATFLHEHANATLHIDRAAAAEIER
jgi:glucosamine-6-phosphate deaminase